MCLTSELEMGCMVPCSRKGEWVGDGVEAQLAAEEEKNEKRGANEIGE